MLELLSEEIVKARGENVRDFILARDFNQDVDRDQMQRFMRENGLLEIHEHLNENDCGTKDKTCKLGSKQIDAVLATEEVLGSI